MRIRLVGLVQLALLLVACARPDASTSPGTQAGIHAPPAVAADELNLVTGQLVYVPAYSDIYIDSAGRTIDLAITLSVRNTDPEQPIVVTALRYYNTAGTLVRDYLEQPLALAPLASHHVVIDRRDDTGGVGASFLVTWGAETQVYEPVIEAVMVSTALQQGLSLISVGRVISQTTVVNTSGE